jgi:hypothetical protein
VSTWKQFCSDCFIRLASVLKRGKEKEVKEKLKGKSGEEKMREKSWREKSEKASTWLFSEMFRSRSASGNWQTNEIESVIASEK